jgi:hypothetical protein
MLDTGSKSQHPVADSYQQVVGKSFKFVSRKVEVPDLKCLHGWHKFSLLLGRLYGSFLKQVDENKTGDGK